MRVAFPGISRTIHGLQPVLQNLPLAAAEDSIQGVHDGYGKPHDVGLELSLLVLQGRPVQVQHHIYGVVMKQGLKIVAPTNQDLQDFGKF